MLQCGTKDKGVNLVILRFVGPSPAAGEELEVCQTLSKQIYNPTFLFPLKANGRVRAHSVDGQKEQR